MVAQLQTEFNFIKVVASERKQRNINMEPKFSKMDPLFEEFLNTSEIKLEGLSDPRNQCFCQPCDKAQMDHLKFFDRQERRLNPKFTEAYERAKQIVRIIIDKGDRLEFPHLEDLKEVPFKPSKYPGFEYAQQGFKTREEADAVAQVDAEAAWVELTEGTRVAPHHVRLGGRGKVVKKTMEEARKENLAKGRLILMLSQRDLKLLGVTEKLLTEYCKDDVCPIHVGKSWFFNGSNSFCEELKAYDKFFCFDAEKFDSNLDPYMVNDAVDILRGLFVDGVGERYDAYWEFVMESLLRAPIVRDDGIVFWKDVGTTSGHSHNSLVQSICTLLIGYTALVWYNPHLSNAVIYENSVLKSLGDDNLKATRAPLITLTVEDYAAVVFEAFGINWAGDKSFATTRVIDVDEYGPVPREGGSFQGVQFLGKYFILKQLEGDETGQKFVLPYRPMSETVARLAYPEREPREKALERYTLGQLTYMRAVGNYLDAAGNPSTRRFMDGFLNFLEGKRHKMDCLWDDKTGSKMFGAGHTDEERRIELRRFSYDEWLDLVLCEKEIASNNYGGKSWFR